MSAPSRSVPPLFPPWLPGGPVHNTSTRKVEHVVERKWVQPEMMVARTATTRMAVIGNQLQEGNVEVNIGSMSSSDVLAFVDRLSLHTKRVSSLKLIVMPRGIGYSQYTFDAEQDPRAVRGKILQSEWHKDGVDLASATVQAKRCRHHLYSSLLSILLQSDIRELEIGMRLSPAGYRTLATAIARNGTLKKLSFRGSHMGDGLLALMKPGLEANTSLEILDLTACSITDRSVTLLASIIKTHTERRIVLGYHNHLRAYPDSSLAPRDSEALHRRELQQLAKGVDEQCGGLVHLELAENSVTDRGVADLCASLSFVRRLAMLGLRGNKITVESEEKVIELMKDHRALARVDLRQNGTKADNFGILKLAKPALSRPFYSALGYGRSNHQKTIALSPSHTNASIPFELLEAPSSPMVDPRVMLKEGGDNRLEASPQHLTLSLTGTPNLTDREEAEVEGQDDKEAPPPFLTLLSSLVPTREAGRVFEGGGSEEEEEEEEENRDRIDHHGQHLITNADAAKMKSKGKVSKGKKCRKSAAAASKGKKNKIKADQDVITSERDASALGIVHELAAIFRDLEIKVSSLELLHELKRGEPSALQSSQHRDLNGSKKVDHGDDASGPVSLAVSLLKEQIGRWTTLIDDALIQQDP